MNNLDPGLDKNVGPDLDPNFDTLMTLLKEIFLNKDFKKQVAKKCAKLPRMQK